mmetsp:Transcript_21951/g.86052  ORF Transcript_21951/g.86052 Transcript_21951/m.86052 type:complete len:368 (+) Transcript_21951:1441-2544(+)
MRPSRIGQAQQLGALVEGLAGGVVDGLAEDFVHAHIVHTHQLRVAAADQQRNKGELRRVGTEEGGQQMPFEVMDRQRRHVERCGQRHRHTRTDEQRASQARALGVGNQIHVAQREARLGQHLARQRQHAAHMVARGELGHDATIGLVHRDLAVQRLRDQPRRLPTLDLDERHPGLVAGRLEPEDAPHRTHLPSLAWLIEYLGISTVMSCWRSSAWQDRRESGSKPQARSSMSSSFSSISLSERPPSRTMTWQVVQAHTWSQACSMWMSWSSSASQIDVPGAALMRAPSGQYSACGRMVMTGMGQFSELADIATGQGAGDGAVHAFGGKGFGGLGQGLDGGVDGIGIAVHRGQGRQAGVQRFALVLGQ